MKNILAVFFLLLATSTAADALTFDYEHITGSRYSYPYGWSYSYDIGLIDDVLRVEIDLALPERLSAASCGHGGRAA